MSWPKRVATWVGILLQGYAFWVLWTQSWVWPIKWPTGLPLYAGCWIFYVIGSALMNGMLASEFVRKTQLESEQIAARQIQQTLHAQTLETLPGYAAEAYYKPFRNVGGDYFDVIELSGQRSLIAIADVSGKGMPAALLAANIQALVRSIAGVEADPLSLARQINKHLSRYTPSDRFATAVFAVLRRDSGEIEYVNAGHNPTSWTPGRLRSSAPRACPWACADTEYQTARAVIRPGGTLLLYTDGLTDSIPGEHPENRLREALAGGSGTMARLQSLVDPEFNEDDITILLVKREPELPA